MIRIERPGRFILFLVILLTVTALAAFGIVRIILGTPTVQRTGELIVEEGDIAEDVWQRAVDQSFTDHTLRWQYQAWRQDAAASIKVGTYQVQEGEKIGNIIQRLVSGGESANEVTITYPEGFTVQQMAARTAAAGIGSEDSFVQAASPSLYAARASFINQIPPGRDLEGYLFPDTYRVFIDDTPQDIVQRMITIFDEKLTDELKQEIAASGRTLDQIVIMASIIEREVQTDADMAKVAGVLWQRFDDGVGLGADATVRYALDKWDAPLTTQDLAIDSAYNTRRYRGLPPGPISNPGLRAIIASVRPEQSDAYYYLSAPSGETIFSRTLDEHNVNKAKYLR